MIKNTWSAATSWTFPGQARSSIYCFDLHFFCIIAVRLANVDKESWPALLIIGSFHRMLFIYRRYIEIYSDALIKSHWPRRKCTTWWTKVRDLISERSTKLLLPFFLIWLATNQTNHEPSDATATKPVGVGRRRKLRRVRSMIESSIETLTDDKGKEHRRKKSSSSISSDKRPFPFGQW